MRKLLIVLAAAAFFAACNNHEAETKAKQEALRAVKDSLKLDSFKRSETARIKQHIIDSTQRAAAASEARHNSRVAGYSQSYTNDQPQAAAQQPAKKGWSSAAKGAAIGGGAGIVGGLLIDKNKGRGAAIGGVVGAGTGYLIGRSKDKKTGRAQ